MAFLFPFSPEVLLVYLIQHGGFNFKRELATGRESVMVVVVNRILFVRYGACSPIGVSPWDFPGGSMYQRKKGSLSKTPFPPGVLASRLKTRFHPRGEIEGIAVFSVVSELLSSKRN